MKVSAFKKRFKNITQAEQEQAILEMGKETLNAIIVMGCLKTSIKE